MWIRSQDKHALVNTDEIYVCDGWDDNYSIRGKGYRLGVYSTQEKALKVLDEIHCSLNNGATNVYQMPQDEDI